MATTTENTTPPPLALAQKLGESMAHVILAAAEEAIARKYDTDAGRAELAALLARHGWRCTPPRATARRRKGGRG